MLLRLHLRVTDPNGALLGIQLLLMMLQCCKLAGLIYNPSSDRQPMQTEPLCALLSGQPRQPEQSRCSNAQAQIPQLRLGVVCNDQGRVMGP